MFTEILAAFRFFASLATGFVVEIAETFTGRR